MSDSANKNGHNRVPMMNLAFDNVSLTEVFETIDKTVDSGSYCYMASLNVDMVAKAETDEAFKEAILNADLLLMDSTPLMKIALNNGIDVAEKLPGSALLPLVCEHAAEKGYSCFFLGGAEGVPELAAANMVGAYPGLQIAGTLSPKYGFEKDADDLAAVVNVIRRSKADLLFVCLGAPKSEKLCHGLFDLAGVHYAFCVGAAVDFAAGNVSRAPEWVQDAGLEWFYRFTKEPKRLFKRYFVDSWKVAPYLMHPLGEVPAAGKSAYAYKVLNGYYWWLDKIDKQKYIEVYPKYLRKLGVRINEQPGDCWISPTIFLDSAGYDLIEIGDDCTISFDVVILVHDYSINTALRMVGEPQDEKHKMVKRGVKIGDNCFVGARSILMPGAELGDNCIVGSGAVVRGKVPAGSIVSGNPATVIGRVDEFARRRLERGDWVFDSR